VTIFVVQDSLFNESILRTQKVVPNNPKKIKFIASRKFLENFFFVSLRRFFKYVFDCIHKCIIFKIFAFFLIHQLKDSQIVSSRVKMDICSACVCTNFRLFWSINNHSRSANIFSLAVEMMFCLRKNQMTLSHPHVFSDGRKGDDKSDNQLPN
jgi:hypothetical protein